MEGEAAASVESGSTQYRTRNLLDKGRNLVLVLIQGRRELGGARGLTL